MKNRKIKFRAWDGVQMVYSDDEFIKTDSYIGAGDILKRYDNIMQYTGLKDIKETEIYECDICECEIESENFGYLKLRGEMKWIEDEARFSIEFSSEIPFDNRKVKSVAVVGNLHETLLKVPSELYSIGPYKSCQLKPTIVQEIIKWTSENSFNITAQDGTHTIAIDHEEIREKFNEWLKEEEEQNKTKNI